ncbi:MAG: TIGR02444 family protein [Gammaproteobacteria bacterium]|nr:TIGR02444 family protein [Gammaproteobacteria bacterium]
MSESFWDFSIRTYSCEQVPEACLTLQNNYGVDVNILLFTLWYGHTRGPIAEPLFREVLDFSGSWSAQVVVPLRGVRTWLKTDGCEDSRMHKEDCQMYREKVKKLELAGEKIQQEVLQSMVLGLEENAQSLSMQLEFMLLNSAAYFSFLEIEMGKELKDQLSVIVGAGIKQLSEAEVLAELG